MSKQKRKYQKPLAIEMEFDEALERFVGVDPAEVQAEIDKDVGAGRKTRGQAIEDLMLAFEGAAHQDEQGEYWLARQLAPLLGYKDYRNFLNAVEKAKVSCQEGGEQVADHFGDVTVMIPIGKGAERQIDDIELTRFACYLIAQNGDPTKRPEIAAAQTYFAIQTRRQEQADQAQLSDDQKRVLLRDRLKEHNKLLAETASAAGVSNFKNFNGAGLKGLYGGLSQAQVVRRKGLPPGSKHLDHAGHAELAANYFKATQAEEKLRRRVKAEGEIGQRASENLHKEVGTDLHDWIVEQGNTPPEDLKAEEHIKEARKRVKASEPKKLEKKG